MNVGEMLSQSAARFGDDLALAVVADGASSTHTFRSLDGASNRVANGLLEAGIGYGDPVAVLSRNSLAFVETLFATQKIGAPVVPINVRFDESDVEYVLDDAEPAAVIAQHSLLAEGDVGSILADRESRTYVVGSGDAVADDHAGFDSFDRLTQSSADPPGVTVDGDTVDGYFYTSGSSGRPKGVVHRHADRVFVDMNVVSEFGLRREDVNCTPLPLFHSGPLYTGLMPFVQFGVPTVVFREFDPEATLEAVEDWGVTVLGAVPAQYERLAEAAEKGDFDLDTLRFWWVSGAPMPAERRERCREVLCDSHSVVYGATEVGPPISTLQPEASDRYPDACGTGHMGQEIRIVDADGDRDPAATVDRGDAGEIAVRGESVMDRYLNRPELTDEVLVEGWYFTGDVGRRDEDGYLFVEGRLDDMIISGGENIYPDEIEGVLRRHDGIADVVVLGVDHDEWGQTPKAFVVAENSGLDAEAVIEHCRESDLADYKRPREVAFVDDIPRNPSGGSVLKEELRARS